MTDSVLIVGFGNDLMADDGVGPEVVNCLLRSGLPAGARAAHGGSDTLRLPSLWQGEERVWLVDAVIGGGRPGTVYRLDHDDLSTVAQRHGTAHALSLPESLRWIALAYPQMVRVRYRLWGVEPGEIVPRPGLSAAVAAAAAAVASEIVAALAEGAPGHGSQGRS